MDENGNIFHNGIVKSVSGNMVKVEILDDSACTSCEMSGSCEVAGFIDKVVEIKTGENFRAGESVSVIMTEKQGMMASFFGYILPFALVIAVFFMVGHITENELVIGLSGLAILLPYYGLLYLLKKHLKSSLGFKIEKINKPLSNNGFSD